MAKLIVNPSSASRREIPLPRTVLSIGRDPGNDLVLADAMVSRRHAVVEMRGSQYYLRDCNSSNGSLVNGDRISERSLRDGDLVAIGTARLLFRDELIHEDSSGKIVQHPSAPRLSCIQCGADYRKGDLYCRQCGAGIAPPPPAKVVCAACGTAVALPARFCSACGQVLPAEAAAPPAAAPAPAAPPASLPSLAPAGERLAADGSAVVAAPEPVASPAPEPLPQVDALPTPVAPARPDPGGSSQALPELELVPEPAKPPLPRAVRPAPPVVRPPVPPSAARPTAPPPQAVEPAPTRARLAAGLVDLAVAWVVQLLLVGPVAWYWWGKEIPRDPAAVSYGPILLSFSVVPLALLVVGAYFVHGWGVAGATPGKRLMGLAVEGAKGEYPIGLGRAALRFLGYLVSGLPFGLGFLLIPLTGTGLHDRIAGTRVVRRDA